MEVQSTHYAGKKLLSPAQLLADIADDGNYHAIQPLILHYQNRREQILKNVGFYSSDGQGIICMQNASFWKRLIDEILENKEYSINRITEELDASRDVIVGLRMGDIKYQEPSFSEGIKLLELHWKVRNKLHN